jgi:hypothetical protein
MTQERRAFTNYPELLRTRQNNRETFIADDPSFEPEQADFVNGFIGDFSVLTDEDLARTPPILEGTSERQKYQLTVGANFISPITQDRLAVATYTDLVNQIDANGGFTNDPNRVFSTDFYAWTPPIDYDKHINFSRYLWTGVGTADVQGEYVTKEPSHSKTLIHVWDGTTLTAKTVLIFNGLPAILPVDTFVEDASAPERFVYRSDGAGWQLLNLEIVPDVPTTFPDITITPPPLYFYVARTGPEFQRPLVWKYTTTSGRWIALPVVVNPVTPDTPIDGMIWEDGRFNDERRLKIFSNGGFQALTYTVADGPSGTGTDGEYIYDTREYEILTDSWSSENWWRHFGDLSAVDRGARSSDDPGVRPILEFWNGIEFASGDTKDFRNDSPVYKKYAIDQTTLEGIDTGETTTIFQYKSGIGLDDSVLGFPLSFNDTGEFLFELTLESDTSAAIGYHYFLDSVTGVLHGIWHKSPVATVQTADTNGTYDIPVGMSSNPDHEILTEASRSRMIRHMIGVIGSQNDFTGSVTGLNSYRWADRNPTVGATLIDCEETHLRTLATLQDIRINFPDAIRKMAKEYNKVLFRFGNRLSQLWDNLSLTNGNGLLLPTASDACDAVLTSLFNGRSEEFPFFNSDMGTYLPSIANSGTVTVIDPNTKPIHVPPSPTRVGASKAYQPRSILVHDGSTALLGHEGVIIPSYGDERDLVWIELQNRFFGTVPDTFKTEDTVISARYNEAGFELEDFYGNYVPLTAIEPVDQVVADFNAVIGPVDGLRVHSTSTAVFAVFSGGQWLLRQAATDDVFLNLDDNEYYIFNGKGTSSIDRWNRAFDYDYTTNEFRDITRRDFERFIVFRETDFSANVDFDIADLFTWNYSSSGIEGHYKGILGSCRIFCRTRLVENCLCSRFGGYRWKSTIRLCSFSLDRPYGRNSSESWWDTKFPCINCSYSSRRCW